MQAYRESGDTHCQQYLLLEEREPFQFNIYSLDTEQGDIQLMGPEGRDMANLINSMIGRKIEC